MIKRTKISEHIKYTLIDGEAVLLNIRTGKYLALNSIATYIFQQLEKGNDLAAIGNYIREEYNVTEGQLQEDLDLFLKEAHDHGILEFS